MSGLFKKKKKKENKEKLPEQEAPVDEGLSETLIEENDIQNILGDVLKSSGMDEITEKLDDITRKIDELQSRLERHDSLISSMENEITEIRNVNEELQDNVKRLLDIYEVVSQKINPFVNMQGGGTGLSEISENTMVGGEAFPEIVPVGAEKQEIPRVMEAPEPGEARQEMLTPKPAPSRNTESSGKKGASMPILTTIRKDYYTIVLLMRWIEFLFERVKRDKITLLLDYYVDIGWISKEVKSEIMAYARGEVQDVTKYFPEEEIEAEIETPDGTIKAPAPHIYKKVEDWRLSAEDHLKSLLFIMKIAGVEVNKDRLNSLEQEIEKFKKSLWEFHGV
ncbi:MAG: flagella protein [Euryarchaeota archaeon]|nr:flagella protein [Euryarchaeota archaeon]